MFHVETDSIVFPNGKRERFKGIVAEAIQFDEAIVVRLAQDLVHFTNENVFSFDYKGHLLWQIPVRSHMNAQSPYVSISQKNNHVEAHNWDGNVMTLDPKTGTVLSEGSPYYGHMRRHQPSKRNWI